MFKALQTLAIALLLTPGFTVHAETVKNVKTVTWNVRERFGITAKGIDDAIQAARDHFKRRPNDRIVLAFDEGIHHLKREGKAEGTIGLERIKPGPSGRLIFQGKGMDRTTLVFSDDRHAIAGRGVYRVTFRDMHMTRKQYTVSQGVVTEVGKGSVVVAIHDGYPTPQDIFNAASDRGRYLRRYSDSREEPKILGEAHEQVAWRTATHVAGRRWRLTLNKRNLTPGYAAGDVVGIKSKHGGEDEKFGGQAYWLMGGSDFTFERVKWTHKTRGVFRGGFNNVHVIDCVTERAAPIQGQTPCLAAPGGGPQIGQPWDPPSKGHLVKGCRFIASGDDAVAFFNASGEIRDCHITDAFCRGILLANSPDTVLSNNKLIRCEIQKHKDYRLPANRD